MSKCLSCGCKINKSNKGLIRHNFKKSFLDTEEYICLKCVNKGVDFNNLIELKGGLKE